MSLKGKFKWRWETILPCFSATDEVDPVHERWARARIYEVSWFGYALSWRSHVDRPVALAKSIEPWAWVDAVYHFFRKGF